MLGQGKVRPRSSTSGHLRSQTPGAPARKKQNHKTVFRVRLSCGQSLRAAEGKRVISPASVECLDKGLHAISVDQYPSDQELRVVSPVGRAFPIHCTAHGKALLSTFSEALLT
ncbi:hypothetical protein D0O09_17210 [Pseudomonas putida]|nr:hypothetical protein D0O09_17210 [Pseudomonas putida]